MEVFGERDLLVDGVWNFRLVCGELSEFVVDFSVSKKLVLVCVKLRGFGDVCYCCMRFFSLTNIRYFRFLSILVFVIWGCVISYFKCSGLR